MREKKKEENTITQCFAVDFFFPLSLGESSIWCIGFLLPFFYCIIIIWSLHCSGQHFHANNSAALQRFLSQGQARQRAACTASILQLSGRYFWEVPIRKAEAEGKKKPFSCVVLGDRKPLGRDPRSAPSAARSGWREPGLAAPGQARLPRCPCRPPKKGSKAAFRLPFK